MTTIPLLVTAYGIAALSTVVVLSFLGVGRIEIYLAFLTLEFLAISEFNLIPMTRSESRRKNIIGMLLLAIFAGIVMVRLTQIFP